LILQTASQLHLDFFGKDIVVEASAGQLTSDAGLLPIRQFDERIGLSARFAAALVDTRQVDLIDHSLREMVRSRLYGIVAGYEDQNDHDALRHDPAFKLIADRSPEDAALASQPTLSRFENNIAIADLKRLRDATMNSFLDSFAEPPRRLTFDIDAVDDPAHGQQQLVLFHGYYDQHQYLPLLISHAESGQFVLVTLRPGNVHASLGADDDLTYVFAKVRARWPDVEIVVRGDCGFGMPVLYDLCEAERVTYTFGLTANAKLQKMTAELLEEARRRYQETRQPQRLFATFEYRAGSWPKPRRVVAKVECNAQGTNRRFVVSNRAGAALLPEATYDEYVMRGESENRNKEIKTGLAMDRLSDHRFMANLFRLYLHVGAHNLLARLRRHVQLPPEIYVPTDHDAPPDLPDEAKTGAARARMFRRKRQRDPLATAQPCTWRLMVVKVAAEIIVSTRRVVVRLAANWPFLHLFDRTARAALAHPSG
jgi:hypothetical protein